jgi:hypothetical protein
MLYQTEVVKLEKSKNKVDILKHRILLLDRCVTNARLQHSSSVVKINTVALVVSAWVLPTLVNPAIGTGLRYMINKYLLI